MGDRKKQQTQNSGKLVDHELYPSHDEFPPTKHEWDPTHYEMARKPEKERPK
jgi:hypothetical protein